jgi:hypothetical protein
MPGARDTKPAPAAIPPSTSTSNFFGFSGSNAAPAPAQTSAPAPSPAAAPQPKPAPATSAAPPASSKPAAATAESDDGGKGLMGVMRKGLLKYLYPDAHDTSSNIGKSLDAVYNKETGRWEFPGEVSSNLAAVCLFLHLWSCTLCPISFQFGSSWLIFCCFIRVLFVFHSSRNWPNLTDFVLFPCYLLAGK